MRIVCGVQAKSINYDPEEPGVLKTLAHDLLKASLHVLVGRSILKIRRQAYEVEVTPAPWFYKPLALLFLPSIIIHELLHVAGLALYPLIETRCIATAYLLPFMIQGILFCSSIIIVEAHPLTALILLLASAVFPFSLTGDLLNYLRHVKE